MPFCSSCSRDKENSWPLVTSEKKDCNLRCFLNDFATVFGSGSTSPFGKIAGMAVQARRQSHILPPMQGTGMDLRAMQSIYTFPTLVIFASGMGIASAKALIEATSDAAGLDLDFRQTVRLYYRVRSLCLQHLRVQCLLVNKLVYLGWFLNLSE